MLGEVAPEEMVKNRANVSKQEYSELIELASELATKNTQLASIVQSQQETITIKQKRIDEMAEFLTMM